MAVAPPQTASRALARTVLPDSIYAAVKERLMDLTLEPGKIVNMAQLARELEVSTTPLREALARLEAEGLLTLRPLQGYRATPILDATSLGDLFQVRLALEPLAAASSAGAAGTELGDALAQSIERMGQMLIETDSDSGRQRYERYREFANEDALFHDLIAGASGNDLLARSIYGLHSHVHLYRLHFGDGIAPETQREHVAIARAVKQSDQDAAAEAMRIHLNRAWSRLQTFAVQR